MLDFISSFVQEPRDRSPLTIVADFDLRDGVHDAVSIHYGQTLLSDLTNFSTHVPVPSGKV